MFGNRICVLINHIDLILEHGKTKLFLYLFSIMKIWQTKNLNVLSLVILTFVCCNFIAFIIMNVVRVSLCLRSCTIK